MVHSLAPHTLTTLTLCQGTTQVCLGSAKFLLSRSLLGKGDLQLYSMAPSKKTASSKGKTRMYLCPACEHRHVPPTGIRCPHVQQPHSTPLEATARSQRLASRRARTPSSDENDDYLRCSGRTRRSLRPSTGPGSSSEDEHSQGHVCHSAHHFGGTQRSTRGGSGSTFSSTTGKVDTSCPTTSVIPVQAGCTAPPARRSHHAARADAADAGPEPAGVRQARAARSSRPAGPPTGYPDVRPQ